jgi:hypothetical protein
MHLVSIVVFAVFCGERGIDIFGNPLGRMTTGFSIRARLTCAGECFVERVGMAAKNR